MKPSEFIFSISVKSYDEKIAENYRNCDVAEKRIVYQLSNILILNVNSTNFEDLNGYLVKISRLYLICFPRNKPSNSVAVRSVHRFK